MPSSSTALLKLHERDYVEKPLLDQLHELGWEIIDLTGKPQTPDNTFRETFTEVVMLPVLRQQLKKINSWLQDDQIEDFIKQLTASFPSTGLIENNQHALHLLLENTSVTENCQTGAKSPTVRFIDFKNPDNNRFIAVCQFKVRILGTEHHIIPDIRVEGASLRNPTLSYCAYNPEINKILIYKLFNNFSGFLEL
jgi:type I restriction enzyme R subunit